MHSFYLFLLCIMRDNHQICPPKKVTGSCLLPKPCNKALFIGKKHVIRPLVIQKNCNRRRGVPTDVNGTVLNSGLLLEKPDFCLAFGTETLAYSRHSFRDRQQVRWLWFFHSARLKIIRLAHREKVCRRENIYTAVELGRWKNQQRRGPISGPSGRNAYHSKLLAQPYRPYPSTHQL